MLVTTGSPTGFSIASGNTNDAFAISSTGQITVADAGQLDFETTPSCTLVVGITKADTTPQSATITINLYFSYFSSGDGSATTGRCWYKTNASGVYGQMFAVTWCDAPNNEGPQSFAFDATTGLIHVLQDPSQCVSFNQSLSVPRGPRVITEDCDSAQTFAREGNVFEWTGPGSTLVITAVNPADFGSTNNNWQLYMRPFVSGDQNQVWTPEVHRSL